MKNKHNTMNSSSSQKTYIKLQQKLLEDSNATCYLVEIIAKRVKILIGNVKSMVQIIITIKFVGYQ